MVIVFIRSGIIGGVMVLTSSVVDNWGCNG